MPSGVTESITNVTDYIFKVTLTIPEHSKPASRTLTIRANQPNGLDRELVQTVQQSASTYEFQIRKTTSDPWSTGITYDNWPGNNGVMDGPFIINSLKMGRDLLIGGLLLMLTGLLSKMMAVRLGIS